MITGKTLLDRGWPEGALIGHALRAAEALRAGGLDDEAILAALDEARAAPDAIDATDARHALAEAVAAEAVRRRAPQPPPVREAPMEAPIWGRELIDRQAIAQLENAMRLPVTVGGALMPDAHLGYGLPIGGVVALENAVAPYMVGVDIACRMMMSIFPAASDMLSDERGKDTLRRVMREETRFGIGAKFEKGKRRQHDVLDDPDWAATPLLRNLKDKAYAQLGTSGTGNHFVDAGLLHVGEEGREALGIASGTYLAVMTHSGSRGVGATIASTYSKLARERTLLPKELRALAWLSLDAEEGQEYWLSMNLAGRFASACHHTIHEAIADRLGLAPAAQVENHHNYAWKERWQGRDVYVHRKGATPAHAGVLGIIPGSQGHDSYIVRGLGNEASINSASHGAGRQMSRTEAKKTIPKHARDAWLRDRGVELMAGGMDEAPQAYKDIAEVLALQTDLVEPVARFEPRLVLMASDGKSEG